MKQQEEQMEDLMMMISSSSNNTEKPIWKLYENPFYIPHQNHHHHHQIGQICDLPLFRSTTFMESELDLAKTKITELKSELEFQTKIRKKVDSINKKLVREIHEEREKTESIQSLCEDLAKKVSSDKTTMEKMKKEIEKERKMLKIAEVFREERVQMKLSEAKILFEEKVSELLLQKQRNHHQEIIASPLLIPKSSLKQSSKNCSSKKRLILGEKIIDCDDDDDKNGVFIYSSMGIYRKGSPESENHHIKRGIRGFVEFPRVVKTIGSRSKNLGTKLECQKAQLRILLKQSPK